MTDRPLLLAVPNVSEGGDRESVEAIGSALASRPTSGRVLDVHSDPDHGRTVFTFAARQGEIASALVAAAREAVARIDLRRPPGLHPHVGALDVAPVVYLDEEARGAASAEALTAAALIGEDAGLPVFLYGDLATAEGNRERAALRSGGPAGLAERMASGELQPDYGPRTPHPSAGAVLVTARPPLVAFNVELASPDVLLARRIAAELRESGSLSGPAADDKEAIPVPPGLPGVRAIGLFLPTRARAQVSVNVHDPYRTPLREILAVVRRHARIAQAELVGLAPEAALQGFPSDVSIRGFAPERQIIEHALRSLR